MSKGTFIPELRYEELVRKVIGPQWRHLSEEERDGAFGVAIVKSVLDGVQPDLNEIAMHLGLDNDLLLRSFHNLSLNGVFRRNLIQNDDDLKKENVHAWCYYAGYASGAAGSVESN
jgi:hypothetical protein